MTSRKSTAQILAMADKSVGDMKKQLLNRARYVENSSPEPRHTINMWDMNLAMKEKERLGINFNRSVTMSLESRWEVVNRLTVEFLKEVISLNDQLAEEANKQAKQLLTLILTRTKRLGMASRMEQMAGLLMHITFYRTVLKAKMEEMHKYTSFLFQCAELLGFTHPTQIMDRYTALQAILNEIREDYENRVNYLTMLQEQHTEFLESSAEKNIVLHNRMANMHLHLKDIRKEIAEMERFIDEKEQQAAESMVKLRKVKASINHCYTSIMTYKGLECRETNLVKQMEEFGIRLGIIMAAVKFVEDQQAKALKEMEAREAVRLTLHRHSFESHSTYSHEESMVTDECKDSSYFGPTASEINRSSNWRPGLAARCTAALKFDSRTCAQLSRQRGGLMSIKDEDLGLTMRKCFLRAEDSSLVTYGGAKQVNGPFDRRKPFRSTADAAICNWRCQRRSVFPSSKSFSCGEDETMKLKNIRGLEPIYEIGCRETKQAHQISTKTTCRFSAIQEYGTIEAKVHNSNSGLSQRSRFLSSSTRNGAVNNAALDKSSNQSLNDYRVAVSKSGEINVLQQHARDKYFLPSITADSVRGSKRLLSSTACGQPEKFGTKSGARLLPLPCVSERSSNAMNSAKRLYYLSSAREQQSDNIYNGFWDDGVFVSAPISKQNKLAGKSSTEKDVEKVPKPDLMLKDKDRKEDGYSKTCSCQNSLFRVPFKAALRRLSSFTDTVSVKDIELLQRAVERSKEEEYKSKELQSNKFHDCVSSGTTVSCAQQQQQLNKRKSDSCLKSPTCKPKRTKTSNSCKVLSKYCSAPVKSQYPPLRQPGILQQKWRYAEVTAPSATCSRVEATAPKTNALNSARKMYQTRNFKKDCLSILANVKLGPQWSEKQQQKD